MRRVYKEDYPSVAATDLPISPRKPPPPSGNWPSLLRKTSKAVPPQERDELTMFWALPCESTATDPLQYWQGRLVSHPESCLAQMAIDYLSAPSSSVDTERAFSCGTLTVTHRCHALSDLSTRNSIVLGAWLGATNIVPTDELIRHFQNKASRERSTSGSDVSMDSASDMSA